MFEMIEKELKENKISYLKLTGQTKVADRIDLVDKFNEDENIKVFIFKSWWNRFKFNRSRCSNSL